MLKAEKLPSYVLWRIRAHRRIRKMVVGLAFREVADAAVRNEHSMSLTTRARFNDKLQDIAFRVINMLYIPVA